MKELRPLLLIAAVCFLAFVGCEPAETEGGEVSQKAAQKATQKTTVTQKSDQAVAQKETRLARRRACRGSCRRGLFRRA